MTSGAKLLTSIVDNPTCPMDSTILQVCKIERENLQESVNFNKEKVKPLHLC